MKNLKILSKKEVKKILSLLETQFGFRDSLEYVFLLSEKHKMYIVNRDIAKIDFDAIRINSVGLYFGTLAENSVRPSMEGSQLIGPTAKKNVIALNEKEMKQWTRGEDIEHNGNEKGFAILKYKEDFLGCGKVTKEKILNYVPKTRRVTIN